MGKQYSYMSVNEYNQIKQLMDLKVPYAILRQMTGRASSTLSYIKRSSDYKDYRRISNLRFEKKVASEVPPVSKPEVDKSDLIKMVDEQSEKIDKVLQSLDYLRSQLDVLFKYGK